MVVTSIVEVNVTFAKQTVACFLLGKNSSCFGGGGGEGDFHLEVTTI